jgi:glycosyltransferase involved in cell wall biosynthesis
LKNILYIWKDKYPWDVRTEKICRSLADNGFSVTLLCRWKPGELKEEKIDNFYVRRVGYQKNSIKSTPVSFNPYWRNAIKSAIIDFKPNLIIARDILLAEASARISHEHNIPTIIDMAENYPAAMKGWDKYRKSLWRRIAVHYLDLPEIVERSSVRFADGIITVCEEQIDRLVKDYDYDRQKTEIVMNTSSIEEIKKSDKRNQFLTFGHHGFMSAEKGIETFLKGFILAAQKNKDIKLLLAGDGECYPSIKALAETSGINDRITLMGKFQNDQLSEILNAIDIGIIPYQINAFNNTTLHNKLFDYLSYGKPVLASNMIPTQKIILSTNSGNTYDLSSPEKVRDAITDYLSRDLVKYSENSASAFNKYNWSIDKKRLINFVNKYL